MVLLEGGVQTPQITVLGPGAPVSAIVVVSLVVLAIYALWVCKPAVERWAAKPVPVPVPPCTGCCAMAGVDPSQIGDLLRHSERLYQTLHEGTAQAAADAPISLIRFTHGRVETIAEWVRRQEAAEHAREDADRKALVDAARALREDTDPGTGRKPR